jgi:IclR family KDG regulon transcriptional repressor
MPATTKLDANIYHSKVVARAFDILGVIADESSDIAITEVAEKVKLHKSTTHRLIMMLEASRFVERNEQTGRYSIGSRVIELGLSALNRLDLYALSKPRLRDLVEESEETAHLGIIQGPEIVLLSTVETKQSLRTSNTPGTRAPAHCSSIGKSILAFMPPSELDSFLRKYALAPYTRNTITSAARFRDEIDKTRKRGYGIDNEEAEEGLRCIGAPVLNGLDDAVAAVSISGPAFRITDDRIPALAAAVMRSAWLISSSLGYRGRHDQLLTAVGSRPRTRK